MNGQSKTVILKQIANLLKKTTEMPYFLDLLKILSSEYLIVFSVKDTPGNKLSSAMIQQIHDLGLSKFDKQLWLMYAGIVYKSAVLLNMSGEKPGMPISYECDVDNLHISVSSEPFKKGNRSSISINGNEYSLNMRGLNIVVYDIDNNELIDSISFDDHDDKPTSTFSRKDQAVSSKKLNLESAIIQLNNKLDSLSKMVALNNYKMNFVYWNHARVEGETSLNAKKRFFKSLRTEDHGLSIWQNAATILLSEFGRICEESGIDYWLDQGTLLGAVRHNGFIPWDDDIDVGMMRKDLPKVKKAISEADTFVRIKNIFSVEPPNNVVNIFRVHFKDPDISPFVDIFIYDYCDSDSNERWERYRSDRKAYISQLVQFSPVPAKDMRVTRGENFAVTNQEHIDIILSIANKILEADTIENGDYIIWGMDNFSFYQDKKENGIYKTSDIFPLKKLEFSGKLYNVPNKYEEYLANLYGDIYSLPDDMLTHKHLNITQDMIEKCKEMIERIFECVQ